MTPRELRALDRAPAGERPKIGALWHESAGDWETAHRTVQELDTPEAALVHAYLHRREGDEGNAAYWYRRAGRPVERGPLDVEWNAIAEELLRTSRDLQRGRANEP